MGNIVPRSRWLYPDRGMVKWLGWLLSDHSAYLEQQQAVTRSQAVQPGMSVPALKKLFQFAWEQSQAVVIQPDLLEYGQYVAEIQGVIVGLAAGQVYLQTEQGRIHTIAIDAIHAAKVLPPEKWWDHVNTFWWPQSFTSSRYYVHWL